jgi:hypothetical protein
MDAKLKKIAALQKDLNKMKKAKNANSASKSTGKFDCFDFMVELMIVPDQAAHEDEFESEEEMNEPTFSSSVRLFFLCM